MERESPAWQPFRPGEPGPGISLSGRADDASARVLLLLAMPDAVRGGWAAAAAVSLVRRHASQDGRTLLADLAVQEPRLHEALGVSNDEGVSDVFLWGASFDRIAHSVEPGLLFAPAGTIVADPAAVAESSRWDAVLDGFRQARATLALYVPHDAPGLQRLLDRATDVVVLATREGAATLESADWRSRVRAVLGPPESRIEAGAGVSRGAAEADPEPGPEEPDPHWEREVAEAVAATDSRGRRPAVWLAMALLVIMVVVVAAWAGWVRVPYLTPLLSGPTDTVGSEEGVVRSASEPGPASPLSDPGEPAPVGEAEPSTAGGSAPFQRFSLQLGAYPDAGSALESASTLSARHPAVPFLVAPVEVNGRTFHRLLAGFATDPAAVARLRSSLETTMGAAEGARWLVRDAGWAYALGEFASLQEARGRARELASGGVQPYVLEVSTPGGTVYRVYVGAYADQAEASALRAMLTERGLTDVALVRRIGRRPE